MILDVQKSIEEGQRKGFEKLEMGLEIVGEMLKAVNEGQLRQTQILATIHNKLK